MINFLSTYLKEKEFLVLKNCFFEDDDSLTEKEFGKLLVGNDNIIKLDMSEYSESHTISKLIGSPAGYVGYDDNKNILEQIRNVTLSR